MRYLIDSNAIIDFCNGKLPAEGKNLLMNIEPEISIITNIELFASSNISEQEHEMLAKFVSISTVHAVDFDLIEATIEIRQRYKIKLPDAIIAATALINDLTLVSRNAKDFEKIDGLKFANPYETE